MFDIWRRPGKEMPRKKGGVTSIAFDQVAQIFRNELLALMSAGISPDRRFVDFFTGLDIARDLVLARAEKEYADIKHVVLTVLFFKTLNDLLSACLSMRAGYTLQAFPTLRAALESAELMEYLNEHQGMVEEYIKGSGQFARDTSWIRSGLPETKTRSKMYDFLNYYTHANFKGLNIFTSYDADALTTAVQVGPTAPRSPIMIPYVFAVMLLAYAVRTIWESDKSIATSDWATRFHAFDESAQKFLAEAPPAEDITSVG